MVKKPSTYLKIVTESNAQIETTNAIVSHA
jgi:hypothetical protein